MHRPSASLDQQNTEPSGSVDSLNADKLKALDNQVHTQNEKINDCIKQSLKMLVDVEVKVADAMSELLPLDELVGSAMKMKGVIIDTLTQLEDTLTTTRGTIQTLLKSKKDSKDLDEKVVALNHAKDIIGEANHEVAAAKSFVNKHAPKDKAGTAAHSRTW